MYRSRLTALSIFMLAIAGYANAQHDTHTTTIRKAIAVLHPTEGNTVSGVVTFTHEETGIRVVAEITGLEPGNHGFHVHQLGDCTAPNGTSAGGHFNPAGHEHGGPEAEKRHVGDLGNILADDSGTARVDFVDPLLSFSGPGSIIGRAVIVHADPDDLMTQPTGNAGGRVACGVIGVGAESD